MISLLPDSRSRDAAIRLLRRLTWGVIGAAAGAVVLLATVSAATISGRSATTAPQASSSAPQVSSGSSSNVVSGGS